MMSALGFFGRALLVRPRFAIGYAILTVVVLAALLAPAVVPYSPIEANSNEFLQPPSRAHLFGTDAVGMDIFSRTITAPRIDLAIAILGTLLSAIVGTTMGALVGFYSVGVARRSGSPSR